MHKDVQRKRSGEMNQGDEATESYCLPGQEIFLKREAKERNPRTRENEK